MQMEGSVDEDCNRSDEEYDDLAMRDCLENGYLTDDGMFYTGLSKSLSGNQRSHGTPRKHHGKFDAGVPETARSTSSAVPAGTSIKRHGTRKWKRSLSDSFRSRPRSAPDLVSTHKGSPPVPVARDER